MSADIFEKKRAYVIRCGERYVYSRNYCVFDINMARSFSSFSAARAYALKYLEKNEFVIEEHLFEIIK